MPEQELDKPVSFWLNKMRVFWALQGGVENWDESKAIFVCKYCPHNTKMSCVRISKLRVKPDLSEMYAEHQDGGLVHRNTWCAEWIKYV